MDRLSPERRSWNMSRIGSKNTKPEILVRSYLFAKGVRYRCSPNDIIGKPDICIKSYRLALFVHGCFWHGHNECRHFRLPKTNQGFWQQKIGKNIERDIKVRRELIGLGFSVHLVWECEINSGDFCKIDRFINEYREKKSLK